jgi:hypothetical protein
MMLAKDHYGVTLAVKSHPEASVGNRTTGLVPKVVSSRRNLDEETKNHD